MAKIHYEEGLKQQLHQALDEVQMKKKGLYAREHAKDTLNKIREELEKDNN